MLTTSPILTNSANASPSSFHYGPSRSSHSSPRQTARPPRLPPSRTISSPTQVTPAVHPSARSQPSPALGPQQLHQHIQQHQHQHQHQHHQHPIFSSSRQLSPRCNSSSSSPTSRRGPSLSSPSRRYVDVATQYSPVEPFDYRRRPSEMMPPPPRDQEEVSVSVSVVSVPPPPTLEGTAASVSLPSDAASSLSRPSVALPAEPSLAAKRRNSSVEDGRETPSSTSFSSRTLANMPKRPKAEEGEPKPMPQRYELCAVEDLVVLISHMLNELIETNDGIALTSGSLTRFHSRTAPGISVVDYLHRLARHATLSPPLLLSMVYYIDRLCALYPDFTINTLTVHRFLITAATVAAKGLSDSFWNNSTYARVGGVRVAELKLLELEFLNRVDWKIVPDPEVLVAYYKGLVERHPKYALEEEGGEDEDEDEDEENVEESDDEEEDSD